MYYNIYNYLFSQ